MKRQVGKAFSWAPPTLPECHTIGQMARWSNQKTRSESDFENKVILTQVGNPALPKQAMLVTPPEAQEY